MFGWVWALSWLAGCGACGGRDYCSCVEQPECVAVTESCFCPCEEACDDGAGACNCVCGGGAYLGCEPRDD